MTFDDYNYEHYNQHILVSEGDKKNKYSINLLKHKNLISFENNQYHSEHLHELDK